jgi:hypothetical protein
MAFSNIDRPSNYFRTKLYTGTGSNQSITFNESTNMKPDLVWIKDRSRANWHHLSDAVRGATKILWTNVTDAETTDATKVSSLDTNGFSIGTEGGTNYNTDSFISWSWLGANTTASNTSGTITSTVSANTTSGFSIVSYTGTGANATVGHGLGAIPKLIIGKRRNLSEYWVVQHGSLGSGQVGYLQSTDAFSSTGTWNNTDPTSSTFGIGTTNNINASGSTYIAYCFAEVKGFSKAFSYTGNGSTDGSYVNLGFKPAWILIKKSDGAVQNWVMHDSKRSTFNLSQNKLFANLSDAEDTGATYYNLDILSNGFKLRSSNSDVNSSGGAYIGFAIAENPFTSSKGIPTTAR